MPHTTTPPPCTGVPGLFFGPDGQRDSSPAGRKRVTAAKAVCFTCPIRIACRDEARTSHAHGVWGGESESDRRKVGFAPKPVAVPRIAACATEAGARRHRREGQPPCIPCLNAEAEANGRRKAARAEERPPTMPKCGPLIMRLMARGHSNQHIANELNVTRRTIYSHQQRIRRALGFDTNEQLIEAAIASVLNGLLAEPAEAQVA